MNIVLQLILPVVVAAAIAGLGVAGAWLAKRLGKQEELSGIATAVEMVRQAAQDTVGELQQTLVDGWKEAQGGKLTPEQVRQLKYNLKTKTLAKLSEPVMDLLETTQTDVQAIITGAAESLVGRINAVPEINKIPEIAAAGVAESASAP